MLGYSDLFDNVRVFIRVPQRKGENRTVEISERNFADLADRILTEEEMIDSACTERTLLTKGLTVAEELFQKLQSRTPKDTIPGKFRGRVVLGEGMEIGYGGYLDPEVTAGNIRIDISLPQQSESILHIRMFVVREENKWKAVRVGNERNLVCEELTEGEVALLQGIVQQLS